MATPRLTQAQLREQAEDVGRNATDNPSMGDVIDSRFSRRGLMRGALAVSAISATLGPLALAASKSAKAAMPSFSFDELVSAPDSMMHVAPGHQADVLIRWGDPVVAGAPEFDVMNQSARSQLQQFGYNNDFVGYFPIDGSSDHGLLGVNHEYTNEELMFPGVSEQIAQEKARVAAEQAAIEKAAKENGGTSEAEPNGGKAPKPDSLIYLTQALAEIEMAAHGGSVIEIVKQQGAWKVVPDSRFNRRITAFDTEMEITGPAAGHMRLQTSQDSSGTRVIGMVNNCAGGMTPWGTWLSAEENFHGYFTGELTEDHPEYKNYKRYGVGDPSYGWGRFFARFDIEKEPNSANRYGWMVEIDPYDPGSTPKKRTAMGRFKHEGATTIVNGDGRVVAYMGDDERFDYVYKFVTAGTYDPDDRAANMDLLDEGTLYVGKFDADGKLTWLPLTFGESPLTPENGFESQADVVIGTRLAADLLGATKMDRPEDVEPNPTTNRVYMNLTNNTKRKPDQVDAANPRPDNAFGHIIEMIPPDGDHGSTQFSWDILVKCGDPSIAEVGSTFSAQTSKEGWFGMPDNCAVDSQGRLWIATDGNNPKDTGRTDGLWAIETEGDARGTARSFFHVPIGAEMCGPMFVPDDTTMFLAVQHPGEEDAEGNGGTFEKPATRWPDFQEGMPPRPSLVVITKEGGGKVA